MIKLSEKSRRVLRAIYRGLGATAVTLGIQACDPLILPGAPEYGMPPGYPYDRGDLLIFGYVKSQKTGEPIKGISTWVKGVTNYYADYTNYFGRFYFYVPKKDDYTIIFTDVDGVENGGSYKQHTINRTWEQLEALDENGLIIELEEVDEK